MDAIPIDHRATRAPAWAVLRLPAYRMAGRSLAALLVLAAGAAMAVSGQVQFAPPTVPHTASAPAAMAPDPVSPAASNAPAVHMRPAILPMLSDEVRLAALQEGKRLRSTTPAAASAPAPAARPVVEPAVVSSARSGAPVDSAVAYALVTDITRTRVASELRQQLMGSSAAIGVLPGMPRTDLMQVDTGWRAVVWPFATESEADKARRLLAERGIRTELLKF